MEKVLELMRITNLTASELKKALRIIRGLSRDQLNAYLDELISRENN